jgi:hypothetical protein
MSLAAQVLGVVLPNPDAGAQMFELFRRAGLSEPSVSCELPVDGGESSPFYEWCVRQLCAACCLTAKGLASIPGETWRIWRSEFVKA